MQLLKYPAVLSWILYAFFLIIGLIRNIHYKTKSKKAFFMHVDSLVY